jgi:hypothetical protein
LSYLKSFACEHLTLCLSTALRSNVFLRGHWSDEYVHLEGFNLIVTVIEATERAVFYTISTGEIITAGLESTTVLQILEGCLSVTGERQSRELISGPSRGTKISLLSLTRAQSRVVTGLLTGHNTLRRQLHLMGLTDSPLCRKCGAEDQTSAHILCRCEALASIRQAHLAARARIMK